MPTEPHPDAIHAWFELSYAQFLTVPRIFMQSMPASWQARMVDLLNELDEAFDWRPPGGAQYWVRLRDEKGRFFAPDDNICDYQHGSVEQFRKKPAGPYDGMCAPGTHRWKSQLQSTPDVHEWETWCDECGCQSDPREDD